MEYLDVVDAFGRPTGAVTARETAHRQGIRHRTSHLWLLRRRAGRVQVLLQLRSMEKDSHPGCWDISSAGHIPAGADWIPSALRELEEELGVSARPEDLTFCGQRQIHLRDCFHGVPFRDEQVSNVYTLWLDRAPEEFSLQAQEVSRVEWFDWEALFDRLADPAFPNCVSREELAMLRAAIEKEDRR